MKKFLFSVLLFCLSFCALKAQENVIYKVNLKIKEDASVLIEEKLKIIAEEEMALPFTRRINEKPKLVNLSLNSKHINSRLDKENQNFVISSQPLLMKEGANIITLTYQIPQIVVPGISKDTFYYNLGIKGWYWNIDRGSVTFGADTTHIINESKINLETDEGNQNFYLDENVPFKIQEFDKYKDISVKIVFEKGFLAEGSFWFYWLKQLLVLVPFLVTLFMVIYSYRTWLKYGKDPEGPFVTQYAPPTGITPAFAMFILDKENKEHLAFDYFFITLVNLIMKKYVAVSQEKGQVCITSLKGTDSSGLYEEDKLIYTSLFAYSPKIILGAGNLNYMYNALNALINRLEIKRDNFYSHNLFHIIIPATLTVLSFGVIFVSSGMMICVSVVCFIISLATFILFLMFIDNVTPEFKKLYCQIMGFKQYLEIAEQGRIEFSNPFDKERIFCDYLPYAYAFGIGKGLVNMFPAYFSPSLVASLNCMISNKTMMYDMMHVSAIPLSSSLTVRLLRILMKHRIKKV